MSEKEKRSINIIFIICVATLPPAVLFFYIDILVLSLLFIFIHWGCLFLVLFLKICYLPSIREGIKNQQERQQKRQQEWDQIERTIIEAEYQEVLRQQKCGAVWDIKYATDPCPFCGHYKVRNTKWDDKKISVAFWGAASDTIGKAYICDHCNKMW